LSRNLGIHISTKIYFICLRVKELFEHWFSIFEVGLLTFAQHINVNEIFPFLFERTWLKREKFKVIITQDDCDMIHRKGQFGVENPHVYLKPLIKFWDILKGAYDYRNTVIIDSLKWKHMCNDEGNYVITKGYNCDYMNETYLLDHLWPS